MQHTHDNYIRYSTAKQMGGYREEIRPNEYMSVTSLSAGVE